MAAIPKNHANVIIIRNIINPQTFTQFYYTTVKSGTCQDYLRISNKNSIVQCKRSQIVYPKHRNRRNQKQHTGRKICDKIPARLKSIVGSSTAASLTVPIINTIFFTKSMVQASQLLINLLEITLVQGFVQSFYYCIRMTKVIMRIRNVIDDN